jgi:type I restriction enzyme, S subunit
MKEGWKMVKLGDVLRQSRQEVKLSPEQAYKQVTIKINRKGVTLRGMIQGSQVGSNQFLAKPNQFMVSKIDARNGAYGIVPNELDGAIVTGDFVLFDPNERLDVSFLNYFANTQFFDFECKKASEGTTNRVRLKIEKFLQIEIPLPPLTEQQRIAGRLAALKGKIDAVRGLRGEQEKEMKGLLLAQYRNIIEGAEWMPMKEVAPIIRREVAISENESYPELGIRSFGKGTFHKPALNGLEVGTKRLYRINKGDLLFSNVFAWEGAIAVAQPQDDGRFGSHRFISCLCKDGMALPEFLCFHFLTEKGLGAINAASPGGAGRNKTLGLNKLEQILVPLPDIHLQHDFLQLQTKMELLKAAQAGQLAGLEGLFPAVLERAFRGEW